MKRSSNIPDLSSRSCFSRRRFLTAMSGISISGLIRASDQRRIVQHEIGITTASFAPQFRSTEPQERIKLADIPRIVRNELGLRIIDLNTTTLQFHDPSHVARFRREVDAAGCIVTNLKINISASVFDENEELRNHALAEYRHWIRAAADLGARWARPIPSRMRPPWDILVDSYRKLCDFAEPLGIRLLVENYRWIETEPTAIPELVGRLDRRISAQPDTLNWSDHPTRLAGLSAAFPLAASCDFKLKELSSAGDHPAFDLKECFDLGIKAGFSGPWCIEHVNQKRSELITQLRYIKTMLTRWAKA